MNWIIGVTLLVARDRRRASPATRCPDDLLSGTGLRIIYSAVAVDPADRARGAAFLFFGGEFPAPELLSRFFVLHVLLIPRVHRRAPRRPPRPRLAPDAHAVPRAGAHRGHRRRHAGVAEVRAEGDRADVRDVRRCCAARGARADQPDLALRAVRAVHRAVARPARLLRRLARGTAAAVARWEFHARRRHDRPAFIPGVGRARHHLHACSRCGRSSRRGRRGTTAVAPLRAASAGGAGPDRDRRRRT